MTKNFVAIATAALMLGAAAPALAIDVSVGGVSGSAGSGSSGGTSASVGAGDTSVNATIGGGSNIATTGVNTGDTGVNASVGTDQGDLLAITGEDGQTNADVNLGGLSALNDLINGVTDPLGDTLDDTDLPGGPGTGPGAGGGNGTGGGGGQVGSAFASLSMVDQQKLKLRCLNVLAKPASYKSNVVDLCRVIGQL